MQRNVRKDAVASDFSTEIITVEDLSQAIQERIGLIPDESDRDAEFVMDIFGYNDRIIDNVLEPEDRQLFYILEEEGLLTTEREETTLYDGREWRTHYWLFRKDRILGAAREHRSKLAQSTEEFGIYEELPEDVWATRARL
ncbi:MAG TPA: DUF6015 family protein [Candidatus Thermoplasmatota archaeon]|jgi:hypothetical protein|nr:DUF6015 family protein [Candidatus Thermoplasmatota archaeon]